MNPADDYDVWVWVQAEPIVEDGEVVRIVGFSRDVTDRHRRERQLYVMDNLLRHNLRNDLGVILGTAEFIEQEAPVVADKTAVIRRTGEALLASAEKEREIIDLLTAEPTRTRVDVVDAVTHAAGTVRERVPAASIEVSAPGAASAYVLDEIRAAVVELLENAVSHGRRDRPWARVAVHPAERWVTLVVEDDAPPLPEMEARVLTGDHEMDALYHSSGIGLWLVFWIVELSGGGVRVGSGAESGNRIRIRLPRFRD